MVYLPLQKELFFAAKDKGAFLNDARIKANTEEDLENTVIPFMPHYYHSDREHIQHISARMMACKIWQFNPGFLVVPLCYTACARFSQLAFPFGTLREETSSQKKQVQRLPTLTAIHGVGAMFRKTSSLRTQHSIKKFSKKLPKYKTRRICIRRDLYLPCYRRRRFVDRFFVLRFAGRRFAGRRFATLRFFFAIVVTSFSLHDCVIAERSIRFQKNL